MVDTVERSRTPLLSLITAESLDSDYETVAARHGGQPVRRAGSWPAVMVVTAIFALLVTVAAVQTSRNSDVDSASRAALLERLEARRGAVDGLQEKAAGLRSDNAAAEDTLRRLGGNYTASQARRANLGALTGFERVAGPGIRIVVDVAEFADDQIRDSDLTLLVDGLWDAGAEAVAINGQRVSVMTAIRTSGDAIEINSTGVAPPYTVLAIGNPRTLAANLLESQSGLLFTALADQYGFSYEVDNANDLHLPAAPAHLMALRSAEVKDPRATRGGGESP